MHWVLECFEKAILAVGNAKANVKDYVKANARETQKQKTKHE